MSIQSHIFRFYADEILSGAYLEWESQMWDYDEEPTYSWYFNNQWGATIDFDAIRLQYTDRHGDNHTATLKGLRGKGKGRYFISNLETGYPDESQPIVLKSFDYIEGSEKSLLLVNRLDYYLMTGASPEALMYLTNTYNFTDEENLEVVYEYDTDWHNTSDAVTYIGILKPEYIANNEVYTAPVELNQVKVKNMYLIYREIDLPEANSGRDSYTFNFTEAERELLRSTFNTKQSNGLVVATISNLDVSNRKDYANYEVYVNNGDEASYCAGETWCYSVDIAYLTIVNGEPVIAVATVKDINSATLALTGDENSMVRYESIAEYAFEAYASKGATLVKKTITNGSTVINDMSNGIIDNVEKSSFIFNIEDSRGYTASKTVKTNFVSYLKPTINQDLSMDFDGEQGIKVNLTVSGNCFSGNFGLQNNYLYLDVRYGEKGGELSDWIRLSDTVNIKSNKYEYSTSIDGFTYEKAYIFQCRAIDALNTVETSQYTLKLLPVYDWSETDFNFNVPVKLNGETVLRHNEEANNTVLSATGGNIYLRSNGTDDATGEVKISSNGNMELKGQLIMSGNPVADYIIETGSESMGSNGTWYWSKWASGKAECYGRRNFGSCAMTTSTTNGYRSAEFTQALPTGLFSAKPDFINMSVIPNGVSNFNYCWVVPSTTTASSATSTGSFHIVRMSSATASASDVGFNIIGKWN